MRDESVIDRQRALRRVRDGRYDIEKKLRELRDKFERIQPVTGDALLSTRSEVEGLLSDVEKQLADLEGSLKKHLRDEQRAELDLKHVEEQIDNSSTSQKKVSSAVTEYRAS